MRPVTTFKRIVILLECFALFVTMTPAILAWTALSHAIAAGYRYLARLSAISDGLDNLPPSGRI